MEHLPQHHPRGNSEATSFSSALSLLPPAVCPRSQGHKLWLPALPSHDVLGHSPQLWVHPAPSLLWGGDEPAQSQGNENLLGHNANSTPINFPQILRSTALSSSATSPCSPSSSSSQPNGFLDLETSCASTPGCAWEPFNDSICRKV